MSLKDHLHYWIIPFIVLGTLTCFYFSEVPALVEFVCPKENWEWGVLENLQLGIIFCMILLAVYACFKKKAILLKWGFALTAIFGIFVFLEEIDYGEHFAQLIGGEEEVFLNKYIPSKNIHSRGNNAKLFKRSVYLIMALIFVIAPFLKSKISNPYMRFLVPKPRIVVVAVLTVISDLVPRLIVGLGILKDGGLGVNIGEFSEVMVYYIFLIYLIQLVFFNRLVTGSSKT